MTAKTASASTQRAGAPPPWLLIATLVVGHAVKHVYNAGFFVILPEISRFFGFSNTAIGTISTARSVTGSLTNLPAGFLADRFSGHWGIILGLCMAIIGVFTFLMGNAEGYWTLIITAAVVSGSISFWHPSAIAALSQRFPARRGFVIALHGTGGSTGEAVGPLLVGGLLLIIGWQAVLHLGIGPALITAVVVWLLMRNVKGETNSNLTMAGYLRSVKTLVRNRALLTILLTTGCYSMVQGAVATFLPVYLQLELGYSSLQMTAFVSAAQVAGIVSQPILGHLSDHYSRRVVLVPSLLLLGVGLVATGLAPSGWPLLVAVTLTGAFQFPLMALFLASAMDNVGAEVQATTVSLVFGIGTIFGSVSPAIAGFLADTVSVQAVFYYAAALAMTASALFFVRTHSWVR